MAVGRISGPLLKSNLERNGVDLSFTNTLSDTRLLYLDVNNNKIGINTETPVWDLDVDGTIKSDHVIASFGAEIADFTIFGNTIQNLTGDILLNASDSIRFANLQTDEINISDNIIRTINTNANIDLTPNGTGTVDTNSVNVYGSVYTPGNITFDGNITFGNAGNDSIDFNADIATDIIPANNDTHALGAPYQRWNDFYTNLINGQSVITDNLTIGLIDFDLRHTGQIHVAVNGDDTNVGDSPFGAVQTLSEALSRAEASGAQPFIIYVAPGEYQEALPLVVPENVSIIGEDIRNVIITPDTSSQSEDVFHLNDSSLIANLTIKNHYYDSVNNKGYAFRFAPNAVMNDRSPYVQNVTVITEETNPGDGDAGRGAWIDGAELNSSSPRATMLFHSCTFISPGADVINMTNGVRVEWLNSFTYFANRGLYAFNGVTGRTSLDGSTVIYGAELRSIGSANVYGTYGAVADGSDTLMYLIQHNFAYVGAGSSSTNDESSVVQANEVVELNSGQIHFVTTDQVGNFRVGDNFFVNLETGQTSININTGDIDALSGLNINSPGGETTVIDGSFISTGNILLQGNKILTTVGDLNLTGSTGVININDNTSISGNLDIVDNLSFDGTLSLAGDQELDRIDFNVLFEQDFKPHQNLVFNLGNDTAKWLHTYVDRIELTDITFDENYISTSVSSADLELRANGAGEVLIPNNNVQIDNNLDVNSTTTLGNTNVTGSFVQTGSFQQTGNQDISGIYQIDDIELTQNNISTTNSNANLELRASGTGFVNIQNGVNLVNNLDVVGTTTFQDDVTTYEYGPELVTNGTFDTNVNSWAQTGGGTATSVNGNLRIDATGAARNVSQEITVEPGKVYDFTATFRSASNGNSFYLRIFESGVGTLREWNETSGLTNDEILTYSFTPSTTAIDIIFRCVDNIVEWDNVSTFEDIGFVTTFTDVEININSNLSMTGNTTQTGNITQTGNTDISGSLNVSDNFNKSNILFDDNVISNTGEGLRLSTESSDAYSIPEIVKAIIAGSTAANYPDQTEKNLVNFLIDNNYVDVNQSGSLTTSDYIAWLQYIVNGSTPDENFNNFLSIATTDLLNTEISTQGTFNSIIFDGDYFDPNLDLRASGTGNILFPNNNVVISQNLQVNDTTIGPLNLTGDLDVPILSISDNNIKIENNYITTFVSNSNLELRAVNNEEIRVRANTNVNNNLNVDGNTNLKQTTINGLLNHTGLRNQLGNFAITGTMTVATSNIQSEIQFDDIMFNDNTVSSQDSNANLELRANGTADIVIPENDVIVTNNIDVDSLNVNNININSNFNFEEIETSSDIKILDNVITTTESNSNLELRTIDNSHIALQNILVENDTITTTVNDLNLQSNNDTIVTGTGSILLPKGNTAERQINNFGIRFNSDDNLFEGFYNNNTITFGGVYSDNRFASVIAHPTDDIVSISVNNNLYATVDSDAITIPGLNVDDVFMSANSISTNVSNSDLELRTDGTGKLSLQDLKLTQNLIQNTSSDSLTLANTLYGKVKFTGSAIRIPAGTTAEQPVAPEVGTMRWNTDTDVLEVWDGSTFSIAAGTAASISAEEMDDLILEYTLIFG